MRDKKVAVRPVWCGALSVPGGVLEAEAGREEEGGWRKRERERERERRDEREKGGTREGEKGEGRKEEGG